VTNPEAYELLAVGVVLVAVVMLAAFHLLRSYRMRRLGELRGGVGEPRSAGDRAYNRLALARREADLLEAQGGDVERARQLIDLANRSQNARNFDRAYELAQAAHETLVRTRRETPRGPSPTPVSAAPTPSRAVTAPAVPEGRSGPSTTTPTVPKNRAEAQFQLRLFEQDLASAAKAPGDRAVVHGARELYVQAHAAFSRGDFQDAFRLALRGRRQIGGHVEALGPSASPAAASTAGASAPRAPDPTEAAEAAASGERCPRCGHPAVRDDAFCRGCGAPRGPAACPRCGTPRTPTDTFCGRCGERYP
jgi:hypothetical protein